MRAVRRVFGGGGPVDPVVLVIEDAQYADTGLLDFLDHLIDWARDRAAEVKPGEAGLTAAAGARPRTRATGTPT